MLSTGGLGIDGGLHVMEQPLFIHVDLHISWEATISNNTLSNRTSSLAQTGNRAERQQYAMADTTAILSRCKGGEIEGALRICIMMIFVRSVGVNNLDGKERGPRLLKDWCPSIQERAKCLAPASSRLNRDDHACCSTLK